jgi:hypothetical protein
MKHLILSLFALFFLTNLSFAACPTGSYYTTNGDNCVFVGTTTPFPITGGAAGQVTDTPTVQNAAYSSGNCIGGFRSLTVADYNGQSGFLTNFRIASISGATPSITVYIFSSNPSASTCTDKGTFTLNSADVDKIIANPNSTTLSAPTGATTSFGSLDYTPPRPFKAGGSASSGVKTIYYALVAGSSFTPATTSDIHVRVGTALN